MSNPHLRAAMYAGRPLLMRAAAVETLMRRLVAIDPHAHERPGLFTPFLRKVGAIGPTRPVAMEDDYGDARPPMTAPVAYAPIWLPGVDAEGDWGWSLSQGVALFNIDSPLAANGVEFCGSWFHGYDTISAAIDEMIADPRVGAIFIRADCPGGVVHGGLYALAAKLRAVRGAAGGKPIWVYADCAASAMYWLAASCDRIVASRVGLVGSIGCVVTHIDYSAALAKDGIAVTSIQFGDFKTDGAEWKPLSDSARAHLQAEIDQIGRDFVADVVAGRPNLTSDAVIATQAGCFLAHNDVANEGGVGLGLADEIMEEPDAFAALAALAAAPARATPSQTLPANPANATKETDMKPNAVAAIIADTKLTPEAKLAKIDAMTKVRADAEAATAMETCPECGEDVPDGDEECPKCGHDMADATAPASDPVAADASVAEQVLDLPEAKGREALARKLAFMPGQTVAQAKSLLAAAPKATRLADAMIGRDPKVDAHGGDAPKGRGSALVANAKAIKAAAHAGRR